MGGGKSSGSQTVEMTPEQKRVIGLQADALENTFLPAYQKTVGGAEERMNLSQPFVNQAALGGFDAAGGVSRDALGASREYLSGGANTLKSLFDPNYEKGQVQAALQTGREAIREQLGGQNAMFGAAGGLGSSRQALADKNLEQLGAQRQATAAAGAQAQVQQNRSAAATTMLGAGQNLAATGLQAAGQQVSMAQAPLDAYAKYASIVFGTPQGSTTPNFAGTQGSTSSSKGMGFKL